MAAGQIHQKIARSFRSAINFIDLYQQYNLDDPDCLENTDELTIDNILVRDWNNGQLLENNIAVDGVWGSPNLQGSIVERTLVSHIFVHAYPLSKVTFVQMTPWINHPVLMPLCDVMLPTREIHMKESRPQV